jgi:hypothetical protein
LGLQEQNSALVQRHHEWPTPESNARAGIAKRAAATASRSYNLSLSEAQARFCNRHKQIINHTIISKNNKQHTNLVQQEMRSSLYAYCCHQINHDNLSQLRSEIRRWKRRKFKKRIQ